MSKQELIDRIRKDAKKLAEEHKVYIEDTGSVKVFVDYNYKPEDDEFSIELLY